MPTVDSEIREGTKPMRVILISVAAAATLMTTATFAASGHRGSMEDQMACTPDVYRLCANKIPDEDAIVACLQSNRNALSAQCARVFSSPTPGAAPSDQGDDD